MLSYGWVIRLVMVELVFETWLALKSGPSSPRQVPGSSLESLPAALATASAEVLQMLGSEQVTGGSVNCWFTTVSSLFLHRAAWVVLNVALQGSVSLPYIDSLSPLPAEALPSDSDFVEFSEDTFSFPLCRAVFSLWVPRTVNFSTSLPWSGQLAGLCLPLQAANLCSQDGGKFISPWGQGSVDSWNLSQGELNFLDSPLARDESGPLGVHLGTLLS